MSSVTSDGADSDIRRFAYTFGVLLLGLVGILVGVVVVDRVPATIGGALIVAGYVLVYASFIGSLYLDLRGDGSVIPDRPFDGESG